MVHGLSLRQGHGLNSHGRLCGDLVILRRRLELEDGVGDRVFSALSLTGHQLTEYLSCGGKRQGKSGKWSVRLEPLMLLNEWLDLVALDEIGEHLVAELRLLLLVMLLHLEVYHRLTLLCLALID